jgi:hypothetical protein
MKAIPELLVEQSCSCEDDGFDYQPGVLGDCVACRAEKQYRALLARIRELEQWQREALPFLRELKGNYVLRCECDKVPLKALIERATGQEGEKSAPTTNTNKDPQ